MQTLSVNIHLNYLLSITLFIEDRDTIKTPDRTMMGLAILRLTCLDI